MEIRNRVKHIGGGITLTRPTNFLAKVKGRGCRKARKALYRRTVHIQNHSVPTQTNKRCPTHQSTAPPHFEGFNCFKSKPIYICHVVKHCKVQTHISASTEQHPHDELMERTSSLLARLRHRRSSKRNPNKVTKNHQAYSEK